MHILVVDKRKFTLFQGIQDFQGIQNCEWAKQGNNLTK